MAGKMIGKKKNIGKWKAGINNNKIINQATYSRNKRGGIRLTANG